MFINATEIIELIEAAKACEEKLPKEEQWIHVSDIAATLQKLIDDEDARLEKMASDWADQEDGRMVMQDAYDQKLIEQDMARYEWPGGI